MKTLAALAFSLCFPAWMVVLVTLVLFILSAVVIFAILNR